MLRALSLEHPVVRFVTHSGNHGQSAGQASGFRIARGDVIITMDADQQNDPADIPALLEATTDGVDCVCGVRAVRKDSAIRKISSSVANGFRNWITGDKVSDAGCTFRSIRREALREHQLKQALYYAGSGPGAIKHWSSSVSMERLSTRSYVLNFR